VFGDGGGARAVQPEFFARFGGDGDEAFAMAQIGHAHDLGGGFTTARSSSPTTSATSTIFGRVPRLDLVA